MCRRSIRSSLRSSRPSVLAWPHLHLPFYEKDNVWIIFCFLGEEIHNWELQSCDERAGRGAKRQVEGRERSDEWKVVRYVRRRFNALTVASLQPSPHLSLPRLPALSLSRRSRLKILDRRRSATQQSHLLRSLQPSAREAGRNSSQKLADSKYTRESWCRPNDEGVFSRLQCSQLLRPNEEGYSHWMSGR